MFNYTMPIEQLKIHADNILAKGRFETIGDLQGAWIIIQSYYSRLSYNNSDEFKRKMNEILSEEFESIDELYEELEELEESISKYESGNKKLEKTQKKREKLLKLSNKCFCLLGIDSILIDFDKLTISQMTSDLQQAPISVQHSSEPIEISEEPLKVPTNLSLADDSINLLSRSSSNQIEKTLSLSFSAPVMRERQSLLDIELNQIYEHYNMALTLPDCAEKFLAILVAHFSANEKIAELHQIKEITKTETSFTTLLTQDQIVPLIQQLNQQMDLEGLIDASVKKSLNKINAIVTKEHFLATELLRECINLLKYIQPVDFNFMLQLITKTQNAAKRIQDKDIILFLGVTGSGKSTTIHFLAGSKMKKTFVEGLKHIEPYIIANEDLKDFITSPYPRSETRSINAITVNLAKSGAQHDGEVTLCDSPGFADTGGVEIDIANGICLVRALQECRSVKPVILISNQSIGDRMEGIIKLVNTLILMMPSIQHQLDAFSYVFTKIPQDEKDEINPRIVHKRNCLTQQEKSNQGFISLLDNMIKQTSCQEDVIILDPINSKREELLDVLYSRKPIISPSEQFKDFASVESLTKLKEQLSKNEFAFKRAFETGQIEIANYRLNQLKMLREKLSIDEVEKSYKDLLIFVKCNFDAKQEHVNVTFKRILHEGNLSIEDDLQASVKEISYLCKMEILRAKQIADYSNLIQLTEGCLLKLLKNLQKLIISDNGTKLDPSISSSSTLPNSVPKNGFVSLDKIEQLVRIFSDVFVYDQPYVKKLQAIYCETCNFIQQLFIQSYGAADQALQQGKFDTFIIFAEQLTELQTNYKKHLHPEMEEKYSRLSSEVRSYLFAKVKQINEIFPQLNDRIKEVQDFGAKGKHIEDRIVQDEKTVVAEFGNSIAKEITLIYQACGTNGLEKYYDDKELRSEIQKIEGVIEEYFKDVEQKGFFAVWAANKVTSFSYFYIQLASLDALRQNWQIREKMQDNYSRIIRQIESNISEINNGACSQLELFQQLQFSNSVAINYDALKNYAVGLTNATIFLGHSENIYHDELLQIKLKLEESINNVSLQLSEARISLDTSYVLPTLLILISNLREIVPIESLLFEQTAKSQTLIEKIEADISEVLNTINTLMAENKLMSEIKTFINVFDFFEACQGNLLGVQATDLTQLWEKVYDYIKENYSNMSKRLMVAFDILQVSSAAGEDKKEPQQGLINVAKKFGDLVSGSSKKTTSLQQVDQRIEDSCEQMISTLLFLSEVCNNYEQSIHSSTKQNITTIARTLRKQIFEEIPGAILQDWCTPYTGKLVMHVEKLIEDANNMELDQYDSAIYVKLSIANKLSPLDKLLINETICYSIAASKIEFAIKSQKANKESELKLLATKRDLEGFKDLYQSVSSTQPELRDSITEILNSFLSNLNDELLQLDDKIKGLTLSSHSLELIRNVMMQLDKLGKIAVVAELEPQHNQKQMEQMLKKTQSSLEEKIMSFINATHGNIDKEEFKLALPKIRFVEAVTNLLENGTSKDKFKTKTINLYTKIKKKVAETNKQFANLEIADYSKKPPINYLKQLEELEVEDALFVDFHKELTQIISGKISRAIAEFKKEDIDFDVHERLELIKGLNKYVPLEIYTKYTDEIREIEISVQTQAEKDRLIRDEMIKADNIRGLVDELVRVKYSYQAKNTSGDIIQLMQSAAKRYKHQIEVGNLRDIIVPFKTSWQGWQYYCDQLKYMKEPTTVTEYVTNTVLGLFWKRNRTEYKYLLDPAIPQKICTDVLTMVSNKYDEMFSSLASLQKVSLDYDRGFILIEANFTNLRTLVELYIDYSKQDKFSFYGKHLYASLIEHNSRLSSDNLFKTIVSIKDFLANIQHKFKEILESTDLARLRDIMKTMAKYNHVFTMVKDFASDERFRMRLPAGSSAEFAEYFDYSDMRTNLAERLIRLKDVAGQKILEHKRAKSSNSIDRKEFYKEISAAFICLKTVRPLIEHVSEKVADVNTLESQARENIYQNLCEVKLQLLDLIKRIPSEDEKTYADLNTWYDNLRLVVECFDNNDLAQESQLMLNEVNRTLADKLENCKKDLYAIKEEYILLMKIIHVKLMSIHAPTFKNMVDKLIDEVLKEVRNAAQGVQSIARIGVQLNKRDDEYQGVAQMIIAEHAAFKSYAIELRNEKTLRHDIHYVLERLDTNKDNTDLIASTLQKHYVSYEKLYWSLVEPGLLRINETMQEIIRNTKIIASSDKAYDQKIIELSAHLFAYWTLMHSDSFNEESTNDRKYLLQPHAAQVISIFRLLGMDVECVSNLDNHLVEIGTGEGKSVTMAITAMILALQNYDVDCACYSDYLSQRDHDDFADLFAAFGLRNYITYGTFNFLCERLVNQHGDVRDVIVDLIKNGTSTNVRKVGGLRDKVILIDEVDVFFNRDFYGNFYRPLAELYDQVIKELISYVWENRLDKKMLRLANIKSSPSYVNCCSRFPQWEALIEESVKAMIVDVQSFDTPEYVVQKDKIGYREQHGISFDVSYRYKTVFAYFYEHENGEITQDSRDKKATLIIDCGAFSYAEIPKQYKCVMGVTGTLATLSEPERRLLEDVYSIKKFTYMPSVYGDNKFSFAQDNEKDVIIDKRVSHFKNIAQEIKDRRLEKEGVTRPIMVFFESNEQLKEFYNSSTLRKSGINPDHIKLITEEVADDQKSGLIRQATSSGIVTLLTRGFGRGTDFKCYDDRINEHCCGVHVIQTFVSDELSEETQIKGRTARQGDPGSYSMVLVEEDLERYKLNEAEILRMKSTRSLYTTIDKWRRDFFIDQYIESLRYVTEIKQDHDEAMVFVGALFGKDLKMVMEFVLKRNATNLSLSIDGTAKTVCLMDATGSMSGLLTKAKNTVHAMFERACDVLRTKGMSATFELQFVVYRNYNCKEERLLQYSGWESDPNNLRQFMNSVNPEGGLGNEAIEIGLWHVNQIAESMKISQVILIGDMPPNTNNEVMEKRSRNFGESYWSNTIFARPTNTDNELRLLIEKGIPVYTFFVKGGYGGDAMPSFERIASITGGRSGRLDIDSQTGAEQLTQVVTERILEDLGGVELVEIYREKYVKGYVASPSKSPTILFAKQHNQEAKCQAFTNEATKSATQEVVAGAAVLQLKP